MIYDLPDIIEHCHREALVCVRLLVSTLAAIARVGEVS